MAELGAVASILQVADVGLRLSTTLFTFAETVASADKTVSAVSKDVSLTSSVLRELAKVLDKGHRDEAYSDDAIESAVAIVKECSDVFAEIDRILIEKLPRLSSQRKEKASKITIALERFRWPYMQSKMSLLQSSLERLKSSLLVILHVISLARMMKDGPSSADEGQTALVRDLIKSNQDHVRRYDELKHHITNASTVDAGSTMLVANLQEEKTTASGRQETYEREFETGLENICHFIALFERLEEEVARPSYIIGPHSRSRIQTQISNVHERETWCLHKVHGVAAVEEIRSELRPEAVIGCKVSKRQITPKSVIKDRSLSGSLSRFWPRLWCLFRDPNRTMTILEADEISASTHNQAQASPKPPHQSDDLMKTSNMSQGVSKSKVDSKTHTQKIRASPDSPSVDKLDEYSFIVTSDNPGDVAQSAHTFRLWLKSIVNSLRLRGKTEVAPLPPFYRYPRVREPYSGHNVDQTKQRPQNDASAVDDTAGSSHGPVESDTLIGPGGCPSEAGQDSEVHSSHSSDKGLSASNMASPLSTGDSRHSLASFEAHTAGVLEADHDTDDRRGSDEMLSTYHDLASKIDAPETQSPFRCSTPSFWEWADGSSTPLDDGSARDIDVDFQSQDRKLHELLRLWTPINISP